MVDFIYGVNLSRALTQCFKAGNNGKRYRNLSIGRVQGPTLAFVVDKEREIRLHIPEPYWVIIGEFEKNGHIIKADYYQHKISTLVQATLIVDECTNQDGKIIKIEKHKVPLRAPNPFNLGDLQKEAYRVFRISPSYTLSIAENLYLAALISYPRTSSQKLPTSINYKKIISDISRISSNYTNLAKTLIGTRNHLVPNEGSKTDPAHPAIYPTGAKPKDKLHGIEAKLFDLIVRRFLATFGDSASSQQTTVMILVNDEHIFEANGKRMLYEGWMHFYKPYVSSDIGTDLPDLQKGDVLRNVVVRMDGKFTQPTPRFNPASLLAKMEKEKIGTKATRSEVISTLLKRNYIVTTGTAIKATDIGFEILQSMRKYIPDIVSTDLTRSIEEQLECIESGKAKSSLVIDYAKRRLREAIIPFKENEAEIGREITNAIAISQNKDQQQQTILGACPVCNNGVLKIIRSAVSKKRFVGCSNYSSGTCKASAPLPQKGSIKATRKTCAMCHWPVVKAHYIHQANLHWEFCINTQCPSRIHKQA